MPTRRVLATQAYVQAVRQEMRISLRLAVADTLLLLRRLYVRPCCPIASHGRGLGLSLVEWQPAGTGAARVGPRGRVEEPEGRGGAGRAGLQCRDSLVNSA